MRTAIGSAAIIAVGLLAAVRLIDSRLELPPVAPPVEQECVEAMRQRPPDLSWVAQSRRAKIGAEREIPTVTPGELRFHRGRVVRVAGVLHAEFEWVALYPSRAAMEESSWRAPWVALGSLWQYEPYWQTKGPLISDRCVIVEGRYLSGPGGHFGMFDGTIEDVLALDVWSQPHHPFGGLSSRPDSR